MSRKRSQSLRNRRSLLRTRKHAVRAHLSPILSVLVEVLPERRNRCFVRENMLEGYPADRDRSMGTASPCHSEGSKFLETSFIIDTELRS